MPLYFPISWLDQFLTNYFFTIVLLIVENYSIIWVKAVMMGNEKRQFGGLCSLNLLRGETINAKVVFHITLKHLWPNSCDSWCREHD